MRDLPYDESPTRLPGTEFRVPLAKFRALGDVAPYGDINSLLDRLRTLNTEIGSFAGRQQTLISTLSPAQASAISAAFTRIQDASEWRTVAQINDSVVFLDVFTPLPVTVREFKLGQIAGALNALETKWSAFKNYVAHIVESSAQAVEVGLPPPPPPAIPAEIPAPPPSEAKVMLWLFVGGLSLAGILALGLSFWKPAHVPIRRRSHA